MSNIDGLSVITKDPNFNNNGKVKFISLQYKNINEEILVAGNATENLLTNNYTYNNLAHVYCNKLSFKEPISNTTNFAPRSDTAIYFEKGPEQYLYVNQQSGEVETNDFNTLFQDAAFTIFKLKDPEDFDKEITFTVEEGNLTISDSNQKEVSFTMDELIKLKEIIQNS